MMTEDEKKFYGVKEQDMCDEQKKWAVTIEPGYSSNGSGKGYYARFQHKDKSRTDELTRNFDTFEEALVFAQSQYEKLK